MPWKANAILARDAWILPGLRDADILIDQLCEGLSNQIFKVHVQGKAMPACVLHVHYATIKWCFI